VWTYAAGTTTPTATYTDITGGTPNANPIQLLSNGRLPNVSIWQPGGTAIKVVFSTNAGTSGAPVFGVQIGPTFDQVSGINDPAPLLTTLITPASGSGADLIANAVRSYDLVSTVRAANVPSLAVGQTLIIDVEGGTTVNDAAGGVFYWNATSTATDDGGVTTITPTGAGSTGRYLRLLQNYGTRNSFTLTVTGCTTAPPVTVNYFLNGTLVIAEVGLPGGGPLTSNATTFTYSGWPSSLQSSTLGHYSALVQAVDNGVSGLSAVATITNIALGHVVTLSLNSAAGTGAWTSSGTKGVSPFTLVYLI
jgi:hypothetical protein